MDGSDWLRRVRRAGIAGGEIIFVGGNEAEEGRKPRTKGSLNREPILSIVVDTGLGQSPLNLVIMVSSLIR